MGFRFANKRIFIHYFFDWLYLSINWTPSLFPELDGGLDLTANSIEIPDITIPQMPKINPVHCK